ncbi:DNA-3-methyladenine glycosylase I [Corynebacterium suedekumii]|uniref:DNA-3-methyladenine glycosylase I n=1 Tax=Corynebacterium suedekumii TaxID=3049801 RepID=A0ABY8VNQ5_9CORY|nr:DNA-3-methyladenine glycosylase I [Corynebacterium suedekumii]WIM69215.1 DNA-3-methyladenine glycosylase I [Corynebacterium suedekumii]
METTITDIPDITDTDSLIHCEDGRARPTWACTSDLLRDYYDTEWGMPVRDEQGLFERLSLEGFQAGLSWELILRKRPAFRAAFADFNPDEVAVFTDADVERLLTDSGIIRNRRKIEAVITNARATIELREKGGLVELIWSHQPAETPAPVTADDVPSRSPESAALARALKKEGFTFVGPTTIFALMEAIGVVDTHLVGSWRRGSSGVWT